MNPTSKKGYGNTEPSPTDIYGEGVTTDAGGDSLVFGEFKIQSELMGNHKSHTEMLWPLM
ncbi:MAG: hypothetical protein BroJett018_30380 [Chloroflexota bacterium]|nr:MAG: hypothetical protein BroJett018_30380 [Chloroflexota bacterium]